MILPIVVHGNITQQTLAVALFGALTGCVLAILTGRWRFYAVYLGAVVLAVAFLEREYYVTFLGFSWLTAYILACILKDPTTLHRSLADVRQLTQIRREDYNTRE